MNSSAKPWWFIVAATIAATWTVSACSSADSESNDSTSTQGNTFGAPMGAPGAAPGETATQPPSSGGAGSEGNGSSSGGSPDAGTGTPSPGTSSGGSSGSPVVVPVVGATEPNLKVAFVGDTNAGSDYKDVLALIKREGADLVVFQGDLTYSPTTSAQWLTATDGALDDGTTKIPYLIARGNHDTDWKTLGDGLGTRLTKWGLSTEHNTPTLANYSMVFKGLKVVFADDAETANPTRNDYVKSRLEGDQHIWKICSWHRNMKDTQAGAKSNEMSWSIYETCRQAGAIVAQGHSHTYSRSKTMTADQALTVDPACSDPFALCVGPGKHFFFDSSVGGVGLRTLDNGNRPHFASTYSSDFGALFIEFNVDGDARKARGYFKTVANVVIDPPPSSGKTAFTITSSN
jgi:predicted phosphodiesterase